MSPLVIGMVEEWSLAELSDVGGLGEGVTGRSSAELTVVGGSGPELVDWVSEEAGREERSDTDLEEEELTESVEPAVPMGMSLVVVVTAEGADVVDWFRMAGTGMTETGTGDSDNG